MTESLDATGFTTDTTTDGLELFWFNNNDLEWPSLFFDGFSYPDLELPHDSALEHPLVKVWHNYFEAGVSQGAMPSSRMYYSGRPNTSVYTSELLRVFLGLFRKHIPLTFALFAESEKYISPYYTFAAAALGGLFSSVPGSRLVANALYNDARRLISEQASRHP